MGLSLAERYQFFPPDYQTGREWFRSASQELDAKQSTFVKPGHKGPTGEELAIDLAWIGPEDASKVYVSLSGTHGQEYACGAAGQLQWMASEAAESLPDNIAVCLIHCVNPFGAAYSSRTNEDLIDLNRNFRDPAVPRPANSVFSSVEGVLALKSLDDFALYDVVEEFNALLEREDSALVMDAIAAGQSVSPTGMAYCGTHESWEIATLREIATCNLSRAEIVAIIDWHTGLGPSGEASVLLDLPPTSEAYELGCNWWGEPARTDDLYDAGDEPAIEGEVRHGIASICEAFGAFPVQTVVEIGTVGNRAIIPAFAIDRWLRVECEDPSSPDAVRFRTLMIERYSPSDPDWRDKALRSMEALYKSTIEGLEEV